MPAWMNITSGLLVLVVFIIAVLSVKPCANFLHEKVGIENPYVCVALGICFGVFVYWFLGLKVIPALF